MRKDQKPVSCDTEDHGHMAGATNSSSSRDSCSQPSLGPLGAHCGDSTWDFLLESNSITHQLLGQKTKQNHKQKLRQQVLPERDAMYTVGTEF